MPDIQVDVKQQNKSTSRASIRQHQVVIDRPESKGGADQGAMGGELLLASLGGCFMSTLLAAINARESNISDVHVQVTGTLDGNPAHFTSIHMHVTAQHDDPQALEKLVTIAERSCIVANTLKGSVTLRTTVN